MTIPEDRCFLWPGQTDRDNNPVLYKNIKGVTYVCKSILEEKTGRSLAKDETSWHSCGHKGCVNPNHLHVVKRASPKDQRPRRETNEPVAIKKNNVYQVHYLSSQGLDRTLIARIVGIETWAVDFLLECKVWRQMHFPTIEKLVAIAELDDSAPPGMCFPFPHVDRQGYAYCDVNNRRVRASRMAWFLKHGNEPDPALVMHHQCENPECVRPSHLIPCSQKSNILQKKSKLSGDVKELGPKIVEMINNGQTCSQVARALNMEFRRVQTIYHRSVAFWGLPDKLKESHKQRKERIRHLQFVLHNFGPVICSMVEQGLSLRWIGRMFGVTHSDIRRYCGRKTEGSTH